MAKKEEKKKEEKNESFGEARLKHIEKSKKK